MLATFHQGSSAAERTAKPAQLLLHCLAQILDQVKAIGDLTSLRCALPSTLSIKTVAVTGHDPHGRVFAEPGCAYRLRHPSVLTMEAAEPWG